jgi:hypothetical protein
MTDAEKIAELQEAVSRLEAAVGMAYAVKAPTDADLKPENELPSGRYPLLLSDYQIRKHGIAPMQEDISELQSRPPTQPPPPEASNPVLPLVPAEGTAVREMRNTSSVVVTDENATNAVPEQVFGRTQFNGEVGIGGPPVEGMDLTLRGGGEILMLDRVPAQDTQEKDGDRLRAMVVSMNRYDNGFRLIRGGWWKNGVLHRVQNVIDIFAMDSAGWVSKSVEDYSKPQVERCQDWIVKPYDDARGKGYEFVVCRAGYGARVSGSTRTTNMNNPENFNRSAEILEPLPGAV